MGCLTLTCILGTAQIPRGFIPRGSHSRLRLLKVEDASRDRNKNTCRLNANAPSVRCLDVKRGSDSSTMDSNKGYLVRGLSTESHCVLTFLSCQGIFPQIKSLIQGPENDHPRSFDDTIQETLQWLDEVKQDSVLCQGGGLSREGLKKAHRKRSPGTLIFGGRWDISKRDQHEGGLYENRFSQPLLSIRISQET